MIYKTLSLPINIAILLCAILIPYSAHANSNNLTNKNQSARNTLKEAWINNQSFNRSQLSDRGLNNLADTKSIGTKSIGTKLINDKRISQVPQNFQTQQPFPRTAPQSARAMQNAQNPFYRQYAQQPQPPMLSNGKLLVTTTNEVPGYRIVKYNGIVRGDVVFGPTIIQAFKSSIKSIIGGKLGGYTQMCQRARENAFEDMLNQARQLGANAIVGVQYDSSTFRTSKDGDVGTEVFCYGTAVSIIPQ